jgi:Abnormal spindle-like microcephaly-assoc'd, ASPM-SPD-2-Hydin
MVPACAGARLTHSSSPGQLTANIGSLNFANVEVGNSQAQSVTLTNSGGSGLTVSQATLTGTGFTLSGLTLPLTLVAGQSATFSVVFAPQSAGSESGNLAFASNASNPAMNLPLSGNTTLVAITVSPNNATLVVGSTQQFTANVTGTSTRAVAWTVSGVGCIGVACGTISINGLYVPPSSVPSPSTVTVKATSVVDPTKSALANVAIVGVGAVLLSIAPTGASVPAAGTQLFTASVTGTSNTAVTWSLSGAGCGSSCGTLATSPSSAVYSAPAVAPSPPAAVSVTVTSVADPTKSASANVTIVPTIVVAVSPANTSVAAGFTQQFAASVTGTSNTAVTWKVSGTSCSGATCGTINGSGLFTAPVAVPSPNTATVTATSAGDSTKSASADVTITPIVGTTYYLAPAANGGRDSNNGLTSGTPWLTPNHSLNCGDVILAAPSTAYSEFNFTTGNWGTVTCLAGNNVAWLKCVTFDACKITATSTGGIWVDHSYWGVQGWEVTTPATSYAGCFWAYPSHTATAMIHHIVFANNVANGCGGGGFQASPVNGYSVDYWAVVGNIAYNSTQNGQYECSAAINNNYFQNYDTLPGTHVYVAGNFAWDNFDPNPCNGGTPTDGEGIDIANNNTYSYTGQTVVENNLTFFNGRDGVLIAEDPTGAIYVVYNTSYGSNLAPNQNYFGCAEIGIVASSNTSIYSNLVETSQANGCGSNPIYAYSVQNGDGTNQVYNNWGWALNSQPTLIYDSGSFAFGSNTFTNPAFTSAPSSTPVAPSCGSYASVPACMATLIADFVPTASGASAYGRQPVESGSVSDPLFPQWLCNVNLPEGLVTMGCLSQ